MMIPEDDPLWQAIMRAPIDNEPETEEEHLAIEEAKRSGKWLSNDEILQTIATMKRNEEIDQLRSTFRAWFAMCGGDIPHDAMPDLAILVYESIEPGLADGIQWTSKAHAASNARIIGR